MEETQDKQSQKAVLEKEMMHLKLFLQNDKTKFPYQDIENLFNSKGLNEENFVTSLDLFDSHVRGYCTWGEKLLNWAVPDIKKAESSLSKSFFQKYDEYDFLKNEISHISYPVLFLDLQNTEYLRVSLLKVFDELKKLK